MIEELSQGASHDKMANIVIHKSKTQKLKSNRKNVHRDQENRKSRSLLDVMHDNAATD